jgi:hypothetical protein
LGVYLKSFVAGAAASISYFVFVPAIGLLVPIVFPFLKTRLLPKHDPGGTFVGGAHIWTAGFHLRSPLFLVFAGVVFVVVFGWKFRRLQ